LLSRTDRGGTRTRLLPASRERARPTQTLGGLLEDHGPALYSLAFIILGERDQAEAAVVQVLLEARDRPLLDAHADSRRHLARCVYVRCTRARLGPGRGAGDLPSGRHRPDDSSATTIITRLAELSEQQRAAIALSLYGDHTTTHIADLMSLPAPVVADLLRSGLHELASASPR